MKIVLQRVSRASVTVDGSSVASIGAGLLLLVGIEQGDTADRADFLAAKCVQLRIFADDAGKMNRSLIETGGSVLAVSQFTLLGDCSKGRRPSFIAAADPEKGRKLYDYFVTRVREHVGDVQTGIFGAHMDVSLVNDGPVTLLLEK